MIEPQWFDAYAGQTTDELLALADNYRTDSLVLAFEQALQQKAERIGDDKLSGAERVILAVEALEREVNNGGYAQFFTNLSNEFTPIVVDALQRIGQPDAAALTQQAIDALGLKGSLTIEAIEAVMVADNDTLYEILNEYDDQYYEGVGDLSEALLGFIRKNRDSIRLQD